jgi:MFS family permease
MDAAQVGRAEWKQHWPMVLSAMVGMSFYSLFAYSNQMFIQPLEAEFGWPRAQISMGYTIFALTAFLAGPFVGAAIDRFGPRSIGVPGLALTTLAFAGLGFAGPSVWTWFALWLVLALFGVAVKSTVWTVAVSNGFTVSRGLALSVMLSGSALAQFFGPLSANWLIENYGWRIAYHVMGLVWGGLALLLVALFFRDAQPGSRAAARQAGAAPAPTLPGFTFREAVRTRAIRLIFAANLLTSLLGSGVTFHLKPILNETGLTSDMAALTSALAGLSGIVGKLLTGWLLDRVEGNIVPVASFASGALAYFLLLNTFDAHWAVLVGVLVLGFNAGAGLGVTAYLVSRYAGLRAFGSVYGALGSMLMIGTALGPVVAGYIHDIAHSYDPLLITVIPVSLVAAALLLGLGAYPVFKAATDTPVPQP